MNTATKVALGVGAGLLVGGAVEHAIDDGDFQMSMPQMPQMPNFGGMMPHQHHHPQHHQSGGLLGGLMGAGAGGAVGGMAGSATGSGGGMVSGGPKLHILSANFGGGDVTDKVRPLVKPDNTLIIDENGNPDIFCNHFGNYMDRVYKSLLILYQYQGRPMELLVAPQGGGGFRIDHRDHVRPDRRAFITECGPVIAVVWGIMQDRLQPVPRNCIMDIANYKTFKATNEYFGFDGWTDTFKTAVVFCRDGARIWNIAVRENVTGKI